MATINEADVIRIIQQNPRLVFNAMREDPELLKEVRQAILTDELLDLPRQFIKLTDTLDNLVKVVSRLDSQVGHLVGSELERKLESVVPNRLEAVYDLDDIHILVYQDRHPAVDRDFLQMIDRARRDAAIDDAQHRRLRDTDMIIRADRDGAPVFFTVEASNTVAEDDIDRTIQSAQALEKVAEVIPVVMGYAIPGGAREYNTEEKDGRARIFEMRRRNR